VSVPSESNISVADYLARERASKSKHEYYAGAVFAMAGAKNVHNIISMNVGAFLHAKLRGKPCGAFNSDTKVRIRMANGTRFYYPDAMVVCQQNPLEDAFQDAPVVIVEVLSEDTRRVDQVEKLEAYLSIPSMSVYLLVETDRPKVTVYLRGDQGFEAYAYEGLDSTIPLDVIASAISLAEIYDRLNFDQPEKPV